jgi:3'-phosphoadenosine 5'-phosphosulfate sulfotransferase (PAPS reductase)/FAD synthetase
MATKKQAQYLTTVTAGSMPNLTDYDVILLNTSGGKDSQVMVEWVVGIAKRLGILDRVVAVHADLDGMEWEGTAEIAREQADFYGVPRFEIVRKPGSGLLDRVLEKAAKFEAEVAEGKREKMSPAWPTSGNRWCTSDLKRGPVRVLMTALKNEVVATGRELAPAVMDDGKTVHPVRILNVMGLRGEESADRAKKATYEIDHGASNSLKQVDTWLPIHNWTETMVWSKIRLSGAPYHKAYDLGMSRLSCAFCVFGSKADAAIAACHNPVLAQRVLEVEQVTGFGYKQGGGSVAEAIAAGAQLAPLAA